MGSLFKLINGVSSKYIKGTLHNTINDIPEILVLYNVTMCSEREMNITLKKRPLRFHFALLVSTVVSFFGIIG